MPFVRLKPAHAACGRARSFAARSCFVQAIPVVLAWSPTAHARAGGEASMTGKMKRIMVAAAAVTGLAALPGTAEAHCGHPECGYGWDEYLYQYCDQSCPSGYEGYYEVPWRVVYEHWDWNMLGSKNNFQGCDWNPDHACAMYTWEDEREPCFYMMCQP
jgi:hypothetical protein